MRYADHLPLDATDSTPELETPFVRWPEPSPLQSWWAEIMEGVSPTRTRTGGQKSARLPKS